ncbi:cell wall hydrolase [Sphingomonas sp. HDW15A]|uniref:cell wall hydrolase n=1 Tax=Sphingomonas sp. HDW15A TaxID=2714942 RepID=UPI0014090C7D|nr:cell wall hydrolase [Sphingomonas sp. HDW15A]QIK95784.1 cell wall hydrolase [Sphingomonas sp. HDW15A]
MTTLTLNPARLWQSHPRETVAIGLLGAVALSAVAVTVGTSFGMETPAAAETPPAPPVMAYEPVAPDQALKLNAALPITMDAPGSAKPFSLGSANAAVRANALECLTSAIYYEAGQESTDGQRAVAQVVLNRVRHPAFPSSVCGVVYQGSTRQTGCQFTFTCDGSMTRGPMRDSWDRARKVAQEALSGAVYAPVGNATHYHANYVFPYWAPTLAKTAVVGAHLFYRWAGGWGQPTAFNQRYSGHEPNPAVLRSAALSVVRTPTLNAPTTVAAMPISKVEGVTVRQADNGKRVRVLFTPQAREAVEKVAQVRKPYVETAQASDNLRYALGQSTAPAEAALGRPAASDTAIKAN